VLPVDRAARREVPRREPVAVAAPHIRHNIQYKILMNHIRLRCVVVLARHYFFFYLSLLLKSIIERVFNWKRCAKNTFLYRIVRVFDGNVVFGGSQGAK
jgi:hypothetical protein